MSFLHIKSIVSDWIKVGTMLTVSRWLSGDSLADRSWQFSTLYTLLGFTAYHVATRNISTEIFGKQKPIADDWMYFGTMMVVSRILSGEGLTDPTWLMSSLLTLVGFTVYHVLTARYVQGSDYSSDPNMQGTVDDWAKFSTMFATSRVLGGDSLIDPKWAAGVVAVLFGFTVYHFATSRILELLPL